MKYLLLFSFLNKYVRSSSLFNNWICIGIKNNMDFYKPQPIFIGDLPLVVWKNPNNQDWNSAINICKHMGSKLDNGLINKEGCLKCQYHGLEYSNKDNFGKVIEHEGKLFWGLKPLKKTPPCVPFYNNKLYVKSFIEIDMHASLKDCAFNMMDLRHPEFVHNKLIGFGNTLPPQNIKHFYYDDIDKLGLSFDYISNDLMRMFNDNVNKTNNFHMFVYPTFTWSKVSFENNNLIIGVNLLPLSKNKTRWYITICHNYYKSSAGIELMKILALSILNQDFDQMKNQSPENALKNEIIFDHLFDNEYAIIWLKELFENYRYPDINECIKLYKNKK